MSKPLLSAHNLWKSYHHPKKITLLNGVNFEVASGETVAIEGRSGEGKSTLLQILGTLENPCEGSLTICGIEVGRTNRAIIRNRHIGFVFQSFHLLEDYTALENILMPARIARRSVKKGSEAEQRGWHLLERVGLSDRAHYHTKFLSGGEKQRVALARAMCNDPDLILADEPSGNLDRKTADSIHHLLLEFASEQDKGLIIVTHDKELAGLCRSRYQLTGGLLLPF
jgi:lipoprotein-releasing system ATP-binding protein